MPRPLAVTAAIAAAVLALAFVSLPPARLSLPSTSSDETVAGILHVHTARSDGRSSPDVIAAAAARAGLKFVAFTDHGDAPRTPDPPVYLSGVLCSDTGGISTKSRHPIPISTPPAP